MPSWNLAEKRGFGLTGGFWNHFGVVLIEAPIHLVTSTLSKHFRAEYTADIFPASLHEREKHFLWQYAGHTWTIWWAFASEEVAFALALFLETRAIVMTHQGTSGWSTVKIFYQDKWVEHYHFGYDDYDDPDAKIGDRGYWGIGYWNLEVTYEYFVSQKSTFPVQTRHLFSSVMRKVTEPEMRSWLRSKEGRFGFLDATLQYYGAYLPDCKETPLTYSRSDSDFHPVRSDFERVDALVLPKETFYWRNMLPVPKYVAA
ncbi:MAG: hypothetical protein SFY66_25910 [Oculatellaceae cyanobacterium bins.114]|nr:hypothetical protein [Oculatellaceae cyanobacterium bins.114]